MELFLFLQLKVLLKTTLGDIDVELWSKETPLACRNFVQLCLERYYDGTIFHRLIQGQTSKLACGAQLRPAAHFSNALYSLGIVNKGCLASGLHLFEVTTVYFK